MIQEQALRSLSQILPYGQILMDRATLIAYEVDAGLDKGMPDAVVFPRTPTEVERLVRWAAEYHIILVARGAGTGLSGGAVAERGGVIIEFAHMRALHEIDSIGRSALVEPGLINLRLDEAARSYGLYFPPDPASQRASTIGGNVAENSGGPHCFKYGVTTHYVTGLDVVLADGQCIGLGGRALDYPEYDLCGLVTGSEGMLALITGIAVRLVRHPPAVRTLLALFNSVEQAGNAVSAVIAAGLVPATLEMMDQNIVRIIEPFAHAGLPLDVGAVLIVDLDGYEQSLTTQTHEMERVLQGHGGYGIRIAHDAEERAKIWNARKSAAGAIAREVPAYYTVDITVPRSRLAKMLREVQRICEFYELRRGLVFHAGDGNLHPMLLIPDVADVALMQRILKASHEMIKYGLEMGGSLTGEHGVGIEKREFMPFMHTAAELLAMWDVKQVFDPALRLNPGKIFPLPTQDEHGPYAGFMEHPLPSSIDTPSLLTSDMYIPTTSTEAAKYFYALSCERQPVVIGSVYTVPLLQQHSCNNGMKILSTQGLSGIKEYAPDDLVITVGAGTPLREIQHFLAARQQQVGFMIPWPEMTIGGLIATNTNAPLRMRYGALRDLVLCMTIALPDGRVIRSGRPIVKNVAGYDLTKVFVGAHGTLGLICDVTLKITPQPRAQRTVLLPVATIEQGVELGQRLLSIALVASAIVLCQSKNVLDIVGTDYLLAYTAEGMPEDVEAELAQVCGLLGHLYDDTMIESQTITGSQIWAETIGRRWQDSIVVRIGLPVKHLLAYMQNCASLMNHNDVLIDMASGLIYAAYMHEDALDNVVDWLNVLRVLAMACGGYAIVINWPHKYASQRGIVDHWGYQSGGLALMRRLKSRWDPANILNLGAFLNMDLQKALTKMDSIEYHL